jgi:peptidoglycan hydrolase-like protein with peptidoglycan-binding domain
MNYQNSLSMLLEAGEAAAALRKGSDYGFAVRALQVMLYKMGFGETMGWDKYRADGDYGGGSTRAVKAFCEANNIDSDGTQVNEDTLNLMLGRSRLLPAMSGLQQALDNNALQPLLDSEAGKDHLSRLLTALGYRGELAVQSTDFIKKNGIDFANTEAVVKAIIAQVSPWFGPGWKEANAPKATTGRTGLPETIEPAGNSVKVSDDLYQQKFILHKKGVYLPGNESALTFTRRFKSSLLDYGLDESAIRVMLPVSANEGALDAVNTWDNAFLSFGMYQWTVGQDSAKGELPALVNRIKREDAEAYEEYFGAFGLDVVKEETGEVYGRFALDGAPLNNPGDKEALRTHHWAFRFWKAGLDPRVQIVQLVQAFERLYTFYSHSNYKVDDKWTLDQLVTSEFGVALLLDHHVNRPAYPKLDIRDAMKATGLDQKDPASWTTADEAGLLSKYLEIRANPNLRKYPMTEPEKRARTTRNFLDAGSLSAERGSFSLAARTRDIDGKGFFPRGLTEDDFPIIGGEEEEEQAPVPAIEQPGRGFLGRLFRKIFG